MFCKLYEHVQGIWEVLLINLALCVSKQNNRERTVDPSGCMSGKAKKVEILKNEAQNGVGIF